MNTRLDFLIKTPDGIEATDFQLVHLHEKSDAREFRTMTGGVFHRSGGSSRDAVAFVQTRIAKHIYKIRLAANLPGGNMHFWRPGLPILPRAVPPARHIPFALWNNLDLERLIRRPC